jgi:hypothetical protein
MRLVTFLVLATFAGAALAQAGKKEAQCRQMAGEPGNPTFEAVYKKCMAGPAPAAKAAPAAPGRKFTEAQCRQMAGEPGNPTYEAMLKQCLAKR